MPSKILLIIVLIFSLISCIKDVDFDQSADLSAQPKYVFSLVHFTFNQNRFIDDSGIEIPFFSDTFPTPLATSSVTNDYLTKAEIQFKVTNTFNRTMVVVLQFLDVSGQPSYTFTPITIPPYTQNSIITQTIQGANLDNFKRSNTAKMDVILIPNPSVPINPTINKILNVQVSGIFYFNFHN